MRNVGWIAQRGESELPITQTAIEAVHRLRDWQRSFALEGNEMLIEIVPILIGLIRSNSPSRDT
jgi:hypothetical protein